MDKYTDIHNHDNYTIDNYMLGSPYTQGLQQLYLY